MSFDTDKIIESADFAIRRAKTAGMDGAYVNSGLTRAFSTRFANSAIHQNFMDFETSFRITVIKRKKRVGVSTNSLSESNVAWAVDRGISIVKYLPDDPEFPGVLTEPQQYQKLQLNDPQIQNLSPSDIADKIVGSINSSHEYDSKVQSVSGNLNLQDGYTFFLSSEDQEYLTPVTGITSTFNVAADDGSGESRSNSSFGGRRFAELPCETEAVEAAKRAVMGLNAQEIEAKEYPVILDYQAAADQLTWVGFALSARTILDEVSFLKDRIGEQFFSESLTLLNDPHDPTFLAARALDLEGVASQKYTLINKGVVESYAYDRLTASKMGAKTNGCSFAIFDESFPFPFASKVAPGNQKTRQQLIEEMDDGLLITNLHYTNYIDMPRGTETGMTKDGLFIIKNGEITGAAKNMRFTDSIPKMFSTTEVSKETLQAVTCFGIHCITPAIKLDSMNFSSKTSH